MTLTGKLGAWEDTPPKRHFPITKPHIDSARIVPGSALKKIKLVYNMRTSYSAVGSKGKQFDSIREKSQLMLREEIIAFVENYTEHLNKVCTQSAGVWC